MGMLKIGDIVKMKYGGEAKVLDEFGSGGQGTVYKVLYNGKEYALKWYHKGVFCGKEQEFYKNLENNIQKGAPTADFLWPLEVTDVYAGSFGYIMNVRPEGYYELTNFFVGSKRQSQVRFKSFSAIAEAAINIIQAFRELHKSGYSYQDINNGNFFINPENGKVLICDNDNVSPYGKNSGIQGKQRYMAPEVVTGGNPDKNSDRFSMSIILFRLLFINHPLEGKRSTPPCMTKELERKYYGEEPIFVYDPNDDRNRPVHGTDKNLKLFWSVYPSYLRKMFERAFSHDVMMKKAPRILEQEWLDVFIRFKTTIVTCPYCKAETFIVKQGENECIECRRKIMVPNAIQFRKLTIPLYPESKIMLWQVDTSQNDVETILGEVVVNPKEPNVFGIRNISDICWRIDLPNGTQKPLESKKVVPIKIDYTIEFTNNPNYAGWII